MATFDPSSREAEASAEIAATRSTRATRALLVAGFLGLLAAGPGLELIAATRGRSELAGAPAAAAREFGLGALLTRTRNRIDAVQTGFDERTALVRVVRPWTQLLLSGAFGYGNEQAVVGRDRWLLLRAEVDHLVTAAPGRRSAGDPLAAVLRFRDELATHGIGLLVVPVPVKLAIHPERLANGSPHAPLRRPGEAELLGALAASAVDLLDLAPRFARDAALSDLYLAHDTHWRPRAVETAAREIAIRLRAAYRLPPGEPERCVESTLEVAAEGDLVRLLGLPSGRSPFAAEAVVVRRVQRTGHSGGDGSCTGRPAPVVLLGDSFAGIYGVGGAELPWGTGAGLADRVARYLGLPVDPILRLGGGASETRSAFAAELASDPERFAGTRAVVWAFSAREWSQGDWRDTPLPAR